MNKDEIRKKHILLRKTLDVKKTSSLIVSEIKYSKEFLNASNILIFYPLKFEINLLELVKNSSKKFYLPRVCEDNLLVCPFSENLKKSSFGVMEPLDKPVLDISVIDLAYIPCLAIDKELNRVGYGKGFYDRLFSNPDFRAEKIAVLNKELIVEKIDIEKTDKKVDKFIAY